MIVRSAEQPGFLKRDAIDKPKAQPLGTPSPPPQPSTIEAESSAASMSTSSFQHVMAESPPLQEPLLDIDDLISISSSTKEDSPKLAKTLPPESSLNDCLRFLNLVSPLNLKTFPVFSP